MKFTRHSNTLRGEAYVVVEDEGRCKEYHEAQTSSSLKQCYIDVEPKKKIFVRCAWTGKVGELYIDLIVDGALRNSIRKENPEGRIDKKFTYGLFKGDEVNYCRPFTAVPYDIEVAPESLEDDDGRGIGQIEVVFSCNPLEKQSSTKLASHTLGGLVGAAGHAHIARVKESDDSKPPYGGQIPPNLVIE